MGGIKPSRDKKRIRPRHGGSTVAETRSAVRTIVPYRVIAILHIGRNVVRSREFDTPIDGIEQKHDLDLCVLAVGHRKSVAHDGRRVHDDGSSAAIAGHEDLAISLAPEFTNLLIQVVGPGKVGAGSRPVRAFVVPTILQTRSVVNHSDKTPPASTAKFAERFLV